MAETFLKAQALGIQAFQVNPTTAQTTTSTSFVDMTSGTQSITLSQKSHVYVNCHVNCNVSTTGYAYIQATYDSGGADTLIGQQGYTNITTDGMSVSCGGIVTNLAAGTYTFAMMKRVNTGTGTYNQPSMSILVIPA